MPLLLALVALRIPTRPDEVVECTPLGYALRFPDEERKIVTLLRKHWAVE